MSQTNNTDVSSFIRLTGTGLQIASFVDIKSVLINRYKEIYGSDIDVSTASADGIFINDLALMINNILQTISTIYSNMDVNTANGLYLDLLCRLSNVSRRNATHSSTTLLIENLSDNSIEIPAKLKFIDKAGTTWTGTNSSMTLDKNGGTVYKTSVTVTCDELGPVSAEAGYIYQAIDATLPIKVTQSIAAITGLSTETDAELRSRRAQSNGAQGITVLQSLEGALRNVSSIIDVKIYNNNTSDNDDSPIDGVVVSPHSIYPIIRMRENVDDSPQTIGNLIFDKLTPGISTSFTSTDMTNGELKQYTFIPNIGDIIATRNQTISWKKCKPISTSFAFTIQARSNFDEGTLTAEYKDGACKTIAEEMIQYLNEVRIGETPTSFDLQNVIYNADPTFNGRSTYNIISAPTVSTNTDTYYRYTTFSVTKSSTNIYTITINA